MNIKASLRGISSGPGRLTTKWLKKQGVAELGSRVRSGFKS